jgi:hypothetical protein
MEQKTYTQEQYNDLEVELGVLYATNEKNFETYNEALTKINKLELQSKKTLEFLQTIVSSEYTPILHRKMAKQLIKESTEIK